MYGNGEGVPRDYAQALHWYLLAAEQDHSAALTTLGFMYDHGQGVNADDAKSLMYYSKAAKKGDENAIKNRDMLEARIAKQQAHPH
jgi:TPR repeat protein